MKAPANNLASAGGENAGETSENEVQLNVNLEEKNTSAEESSVTERATFLPGVLRRHVERCLKRITSSSLPAKTGQNPAFHQNAQSKLPRGRIPANRVVSVRNYHHIVLVLHV